MTMLVEEVETVLSGAAPFSYFSGASLPRGQHQSPRQRPLRGVRQDRVRASTRLLLTDPKALYLIHIPKDGAIFLILSLLTPYHVTLRPSCRPSLARGSRSRMWLWVFHNGKSITPWNANVSAWTLLIITPPASHEVYVPPAVSSPE